MCYDWPTARLVVCSLRIVYQRGDEMIKASGLALDLHYVSVTGPEVVELEVGEIAIVFRLGGIHQATASACEPSIPQTPFSEELEDRHS